MTKFSLLMLTVVLTVVGCATAQPSASPAAALRLDELVVLSSQGLGDDAVIAEVEKRGVAFILSAQDFEVQRMAGVSDGVLRYLQGRASAEQELRARLQRALYRVPVYGGPLYLGYPYIGYGEGAHFYGESSGYGGRYFRGGYLSGSHSGHARAHSGGHHGGHY